MSFNEEDNDFEEDESELDEEEVELVRQKVRGIDDSIRIVQLSISKWMKSPMTPPPNEEGFHIIELGYRKVERPLKRFMLEWPGGDIQDTTENIVLSAAIDLANSAVESESYVVRIFGGNDSRTFRLLLDIPLEEGAEEEERPVRASRAMAAPVRSAMVQDGNDELFGGRPEVAQSAYALQLSHNVELVRQNQAMMEMFLNYRVEEAKSVSKIVREQQDTINKLVKDRFETLEARDEIYSRKHEIDAQMREDERKALKEEKMEQRLEQLLMKFVLPALAGKFGMGGMLQSMQNTPNTSSEMPNDGADHGQPLTQAEMVVHSFFGSIKPEQLASILQENTIKLDDDQKANLIEMLQVLQAQYEKSTAPNTGEPAQGSHH